MSENHKFNWGETIRIRKDAPANLHPGAIASVCSVVEISSEDVEHDPSLIGSNWFYTVEFGDGSSIEVPELYLDRYEKSGSS